MFRKPTIAFIFARGGSKGLLNKNILKLNGVSLIGRAIECAKKIKSIDRVIVSTEDDEISKVALSHGAEVPFKRPKELATDTSLEWKSWQHAIRWANSNGGIKKFISLSPTSPLRTPKDIEMCLKAYEHNKVDIVVTVRKALRSPYFNMISLTNSGFAEIVVKKSQKYWRRQDVPDVYDMTTIAYIANPDFILKANNIFDGRVKAVEIPRGRAIDIDDKYDLIEAESYVFNKLLNGEPKIL